MPRFATVMPVALATTACSKETLVPSAKLVTMAGFCPHFSAKAGLGRGGAVGVLQALDVAAEDGADAQALHEAPEVALDARLVAVHVGEDDARPVGLAP